MLRKLANYLKNMPTIEKFATFMLFAVLFIYLLFLFLVYEYPHNLIFKLLKIAFSASLVGAIADTYAVFGLFHNLGPHTNVLLKKRKELTEKVVEWVGEFLLSKEELLKELNKLNIERIISYIDEQQLKLEIEGFLIRFFIEEFKKREKLLYEENSFILKRLGSYLIKNLLEPAVFKFIQEEVPIIVDKFFKDLKDDTYLKRRINNYIKSILITFIQENHEKIKEIARNKLESLTDEEFIKSLKQASWKELQWIRINGTLLGFVIGLFLGVLEVFFK